MCLLHTILTLRFTRYLPQHLLTLTFVLPNLHMFFEHPTFPLEHVHVLQLSLKTCLSWRVLPLYLHAEKYTRLLIQM